MRLSRSIKVSVITVFALVLASCSSPERAEDAGGSATHFDLSALEEDKGTAFWDIDDEPADDAAAGDIVALQKRLDAPEGAEGWSMIYTSEIEPGKIGYVSGEFYVPISDTDEPRDVVLWNHETTGIPDQCAPSRRTLVESRVPGIYDLLDDGRIVVMSDYPGQGLAGTPYYMNGGPNARASLDAVQAVRGISELNVSNRFVQYGWSQGGQTTLHVESMVAEYAPDLEGLGSTLIAPGARIRDLTERSMQDPSLAGYVIATLPGIKASNPDLLYRDFLTPEGMEKLPDLSAGCWDIWETGASLEDPYTEDALQEGTGWSDAMAAIDDFESAGAMPFTIHQGTDDNDTPLEFTLREKENLCEAGSEVEFIEYDGLDHVAVVPEAGKVIAGWASDRFTDQEPVNDC